MFKYYILYRPVNTNVWAVCNNRPKQEHWPKELFSRSKINFNSSIVAISNNFSSICRLFQETLYHKAFFYGGLERSNGLQQNIEKAHKTQHKLNKTQRK